MKALIAEVDLHGLTAEEVSRQLGCREPECLDHRRIVLDPSIDHIPYLIDRTGSRELNPSALALEMPVLYEVLLECLSLLARDI